MPEPVIVSTSKSTADPCGAPPRLPAEFSPDVFAGTFPIVRKGDAYKPHPCPGAPPHTATASGASGTVYINNKLVHREKDTISCGSKGDNGVTTVIIG